MGRRFGYAAYTVKERQRAVTLAEQIGPKLAAERLGMSVNTLRDWCAWVRATALAAPEPERACATPGCAVTVRQRFCSEHAARLARIRDELEAEGQVTSGKSDFLFPQANWRLLGITRHHLLEWTDPTFDQVVATAR